MQLNTRKRSHNDEPAGAILHNMCRSKPTNNIVECESKRRKPLLVPAGVWKTFPRLKFALDFAATCTQDVSVFAYEGRSSGKPGGRRFLVTTYYEFGRHYMSMKPPRHFYEVITEGSVCHLYFDLEYNIPLNSIAKPLQLLEIFKQYVSCQLKFLFDISCDLGNILDLDSTSNDKFSRHLIYHLEDATFRNNLVVGDFVKYICDRLRLLKESELENYKDAVHPNRGTYACCCPSGNELLKLFVTTQNGVGLICDEGVYTRNRNFRLLLSTKKGKKVKLKVAKESCFKSIHAIDSNKRRWSKLFNNLMDSLVCNVRYETTSTILDMPFTNSKTKTTKSAPPLATIAIATAPPLSTSLVTPPVTSHDCGSQYPLIDQFITDQLVKDGMTGRIREWTYFSQGKLIVYEISEYRWCGNIGRHHKSNNIMIIADLKNASYYQKCHDPDCRRIDYRSARYPIPVEIIPLHDEDDNETAVSEMRRSLLADYNENDSFSDECNSTTTAQPLMEQYNNNNIFHDFSLEDLLGGVEDDQDEIDLEISCELVKDLSYEEIFSEIDSVYDKSLIGDLSIEKLFGSQEEVEDDNKPIGLCNVTNSNGGREQQNESTDERIVDENHELSKELLQDLSYEDVFNSPLSIYGDILQLPRNIDDVHSSNFEDVLDEDRDSSAQSTFTSTPIKKEPVERNVSCDCHVTDMYEHNDSSQSYHTFTSTPIKREPVERNVSCDRTDMYEHNDSSQSYTITSTPLKENPLEEIDLCHVTTNDELSLSQQEMESFLEMDNDKS